MNTEKVFLKVISKLYQETSALTNGFNHPSDYYENFYSTDSSAQTKSQKHQFGCGKTYKRFKRLYFFPASYPCI